MGDTISDADRPASTGLAPVAAIASETTFSIAVSVAVLSVGLTRCLGMRAWVLNCENTYKQLLKDRTDKRSQAVRRASAEIHEFIQLQKQAEEQYRQRRAAAT